MPRMVAGAAHTGLKLLPGLKTYCLQVQMNSAGCGSRIWGKAKVGMVVGFQLYTQVAEKIGTHPGRLHVLLSSIAVLHLQKSATRVAPASAQTKS